MGRAGALIAVTLQVQLCEYRQFRHALARNKYNLLHDDSMMEPERFKKYNPKRDDQQKLVVFECSVEAGGEPTLFQVSVEASGDSWKVAERIVGLYYRRLRTGISVEDAESSRQQLYCDVTRGVAHVPDNSAVTELLHKELFVSVTTHDRKRTPFQTTVFAAGGGILQAERVARL